METPRQGFPGPEYARYAGLGLQFAATMGVLGLAGWWLDGKLGTEPWILIAGIFAGFFGGLVSMVKKVARPAQGRGRDDRAP